MAGNASYHVGQDDLQLILQQVSEGAPYVKSLSFLAATGAISLHAAVGGATQPPSMLKGLRWGQRSTSKPRFAGVGR